ncbi:MAG: exosortase K [Myxococcales bacterium]
MAARPWFHRDGLVAAGVGVSVAAALKAFYSHAGPDRLLWILAPSSWVARYAGGVDLSFESGGGFISHTHHLVVGAPCAGVNFLVIAFLTLFFGFGTRFESMGRRFAWMAAAIALAYGATVVTNGLRIVLATHLYELDIYRGVVTRERLHRLAGTVIYYGSLLALYLAFDAILGGNTRQERVLSRRALGRFVPLTCYLFVSVGIPLAGRSAAAVVGSDGSHFTEHIASVVGVVVLLTCAALLPVAVAGRWRNRVASDGIKCGT